MTELLSPAGSLESLKAAVHAGADAVYMGGQLFGARAYADNPGPDGLLEGIEYCHLRGKKLYLTVNTLLKEEELEGRLYDFLLPYYEHGVDAVIVQDLGVVARLSKWFPDLPLHASTQMSVTGPYGAAFLARQGISRVVPARELSLEEVQAIIQSGMEVETFVHGALCYCYSGRCLLSSAIGGRSGNRGRCAQPCRLPYQRVGAKAGVQTLLSLKDLNTITFLPELVVAGIASFKIEGRMKSPQYTAGVTAIYRKYLDLYLQKGRAGYAVSKEDQELLLSLFNRGGFTRGYYQTYNGPQMMELERKTRKRTEDSKEKLAFVEPYVREESKISVCGRAIMRAGEPMELTVWLDGSATFTATGPAPLPAEKTAATQADVRARLQKTGGTPFVFEKLEISLEDGLFLPVRALNELKREALDGLKAQILKGRGQRGSVEGRDEPCAAAKRTGKGTNVGVAVSVCTREQLRAVCEWTGRLARVYVDSLLFGERELLERVRGLKERGVEVYGIAPPLLRARTERFLADVRDVLLAMDGFSVQTADELEYFGQFRKPLAAEDSLYAYNRAAQELYNKEGIERFLLPLELNRRELQQLHTEKAELLVYGYQPLMLSAQCVQKNTGGCTKRTEVVRIRDRKGAEFPILNRCNVCTNTIYNSVPLRLLSCKEEVLRLAPAAVRLSFTIESAKETGAILRQYTEGFFAKGRAADSEGTRGQFKRGVE